MNFRPADRRGRQSRHHGSGARRGHHFFDTANVYGGGADRGRTEEIIGNWFAQGGGRRDKTVLATKVYGSMGAEARRVAQPGQAFGAEHPPRSRGLAQAPRHRPHRSHQFHHIDRATPWRRSGRRSTSSSSRERSSTRGLQLPGWAIAQANERRRGRGSLAWSRAVPLQPRRTAPPKLRSSLRAGVRPGVVPWSPLHGGLLGEYCVRSARRWAPARWTGRSKGRAGRRCPAHQVQAYEDLCDKHGPESG